MDLFIKLPPEEKEAFFNEAAARMGVLPIIIEKDFWVCWTLQKLFSIDGLKDNLTFKGGTSLSKVYGAIERFSEDIDLTINKEYLGITPETDPYSKDELSNKERGRRLGSLAIKAEDVVANKILPLIETSFKSILGDGGWNLRISDDDKQTILFEYPTKLNYGDKSSLGGRGLGGGGLSIGNSLSIVTSKLSYIRPIIKLEFGARGYDFPSKTKTISPYLTQEIPNAIDAPDVEVNVLDISRTFWEKITILHAEFHRPIDKQTMHRLSRHYYDVVMLSRTDLCKKAMNDISMLESVVGMKKIGWASGWASYNTAQKGSLKLLPNPNRISDLKIDYDAMQPMFFGDVPPIDEMLDELGELERMINL